MSTATSENVQPTATSTSTPTTTTTTTTTAPKPESIKQEPSIKETIPNFDNMSLNEQVYELCKANFDLNTIEELIKKGANINELTKLGDTCLCVACNKGYEKIVDLLLKYNANVNICRSVNLSTSSTISSGIMATRRQSRYSTIQSSSLLQPQQGDSPLLLAIKYGFENIALKLIEHNAEIFNFTIINKNPDFDKSILQETIRLGRLKVLNKILDYIYETNNQVAISWILAKRFDILRQLFINENIEAIRIVLPYILETSNHINGELLTHILNYLLMKTKMHDKKEKAFEILETIMEIASTLHDDDDEHTTNGGNTAAVNGHKREAFMIDGLDFLIKSFLATVRALFNAVSSEDRTELLYFRFSLLLNILKYHNCKLNILSLNEFLTDIDFTFNFFYTKLKDTGENVVKLIEFFVTFYDTLITMNFIRLNTENLRSLLCLEHVKKFDVIGEFLIQRSLQPLDLKELCRIRIKKNIHPYNFYTIKNLPVLDDKCKDYLYYI